MIKPLEKIFLALIIATFLLPAALMLWMHCGNLPTIDWIANRTLSGVTVGKKIPLANIANWQSGEFQKGLNTLASENFAGRELLIRVYNQVLYRVFHKSYMYLESIILGKNRDLFEREYLIAHGRLLKPIPREEAEALVVMMKYISERLKEVGTSFVFVITPNKASLYPEDIPDRYLEKTKNGKQMPTNYDILVPLLKKYRVPYVDGREITLEHKDALPLRAFPKTGTHWSRAAAFFTITELLKTIERESGREMPPLSQSIEIIDHQPDYADADLANLLNIIERPHQRYLHPNFQIPVNWPKRKGILTIVGGSFVWEMASALDAARVFERLNVYYYFKVFRRQFPGEIESPVDENAIPWEEDFWNTRAVVLEGNEAAINGRHIHAFLMAGLSMLQQRMPQKQGAPEPPFPLSWGFGAGENGTALQKKGFSVPDHQLTWVTNQYADIDLPSPGANTDIQLILEALPVLAEGVSGRTVAVEVNGIPVGSLWLWRPDMRFYSLAVNAKANSAPSLKLHFSISPEPSPAAGSGQPREIGLARLALVPTGHSTDQAIGENNGIIGHGLVPGPGR